MTNFENEKAELKVEIDQAKTAISSDLYAAQSDAYRNLYEIRLYALQAQYNAVRGLIAVVSGE